MTIAATLTEPVLTRWLTAAGSGACEHERVKHQPRTYLIPLFTVFTRLCGILRTACRRELHCPRRLHTSNA